MEITPTDKEKHGNKDIARELGIEREEFLSENKDALIKEVVESRFLIVSLKGQHTNILTEMKNLRLNLKNELENVERLQKFIVNAEKRIVKFISEETRKVLDETGVKKIINEYVKVILNRDEIIELVKSVASDVINRINKKLTQELKVTKSLCYSIDMEIKHTIRDLPISYETEQIVKRKINDTIAKHIEKKLKYIKLPKLFIGKNE